MIRWNAAIHALEAGQLPCSGSEQAILRIAASLADPGIAVRLRENLGNLDPATSPWSPTPSQPPTADPPEGAMMIENLQAHYGFSIMPFGSPSPWPPCSARPPTKKPSPGCAG